MNGKSEGLPIEISKPQKHPPSPPTHSIIPIHKHKKEAIQSSIHTAIPDIQYRHVPRHCIIGRRLVSQDSAKAPC